MAIQPDFNLSNLAVEGAFQSPEAAPLPAWLDTMQHYPRYSASVGALAFRGSNTIIGGGFGGAAKSGYVREGIRQFNPLRARTWMRMGDQSLFHHTGPTWTRGAAKGSATYNPFYASQFINWIGRKATSGEGIVGKGAAATLGKTGLVAPGTELMSKGFLGRVTAGSRIGAMDAARFGRLDKTALRAFVGGSGFGAQSTAAIMGAGPQAARQALLMGGTGTLSGRIGGFMAASRGQIDKSVIRGLTAAERAGGARGAGAAAALHGRNVASRWMYAPIKQGGLGMTPAAQHTTREIIKQGAKATRSVATKAGTMAATKIAGKAGMVAMASIASGPAAPFVAAAGYAWLAHDLAKMGTKAMGHTAGLFVEGAKSFRGDLNVGIMGRTFRDNEVTMTSRARGVQAIQNSRLNARSILGNEAAAMAGHFG